MTDKSVLMDTDPANETVKTIALRLGISHSTVSRALNSAKRHLVAPKTRARIEALAHDLRYRPSGIARALRGNRSNLLGFYTVGGYGLEGGFATNLIVGLQNACERSRYQLLLLSGALSNWQTPFEETLMALWNSQIDGLVLQSMSNDPLILRLRDTTLPLVAISDAPEGIPLVRPDDVGGMDMLLKHIYSLGYRRIAFVRPDYALPSAQRRCQAYEQFCEQAGILTDVIEVPIMDFRGTWQIIQQRTDRARPEVLSCFCDMMAWGIRREIRIIGGAVPGDIGVAGFDGFPDYRGGELALTGIVVPWMEIADAATNLLIRRIAGEPIEMEMVVPVTLQTGNTL